MAPRHTLPFLPLEKFGDRDGQVAGGSGVTISSPLQFLGRLTERFVLGVDLFLEAVWKVWTELLDVLGLDGRCQTLARGGASPRPLGIWEGSGSGLGTHELVC